MKKLFSLFAATLMFIGVNASVITFNGSGTTWTSSQTAQTETQGTVTLACTNGMYSSGYRFYQSTTTTISSTETINTIVFTSSASGTAKYGPSFFSTTSGTYSYDGYEGTWTGSATSVALSASAQVRATSIVVYTGSDTPGEEVLDTLTVSQANDSIDAGTTGKCYVYGRVVSINTSYISSYGNVNCWIVDLDNEGDTIEGYKMTGAEGNAYTSADQVEYEVGDTVLFYGLALTKYGEQYEINGGYYSQILGKSSKKEMNLTNAEATIDVNDKILDLTIYGPMGTDSLIFQTDLNSAKSIAGSFRNAYGDQVEFYHNSTEPITVEQGTITITFVSVDNYGNYTYKVSALLMDENNILYSGEVNMTINADLEEDNPNIDVQMAINLAEQTGTTATTKQYNVYGYVASIKEAYNSSYSNSTFYMSDEAGATSYSFIAYRAKSDSAIPVGSFVKLNQATLINYSSNTPETNNMPNAVVIDPANCPILRHGNAPQTFDATAAEAFAIGSAMEDTISFDYYRVTTYVCKIKEAYSSQYGNVTFYMNDTVGVTYGDLQAYRAKPVNAADSTIAVGDKIEVVGKLYRSEYNSKTTVEITSGKYTILQHTPVEEATEEDKKAAKYFEDGKLVIIKNGAKYNAQGAKL